MKKYIKCDRVDTFKDEMFGKGNRLYMANPENKKELLVMDILLALRHFERLMA